MKIFKFAESVTTKHLFVWILITFRKNKNVIRSYIIYRCWKFYSSASIINAVSKWRNRFENIFQNAEKILNTLRSRYDVVVSNQNKRYFFHRTQNRKTKSFIHHTEFGISTGHGIDQYGSRYQISTGGICIGTGLGICIGTGLGICIGTGLGIGSVRVSVLDQYGSRSWINFYRTDLSIIIRRSQ